MLRALSLFGFGGSFLLISPHLRQVVSSKLELGVTTLEFYAPWSYVGAALVGLIVAGITLSRGAQPR